MEPDSLVTPAHTREYAPITERPGMMVGRYKLKEQIGQGGFGLVFVAEQTEPVKRKVALKVIKPGMDSIQVIARFEAERQALALMDHPNIARVLDAGTTDSGRPYFVMELVRGIPITDYCDQNHLTPPERLELFVSVCHAIQHAHQKGVIHRDIKPSNVLVTSHDGKPIAKVIDFGVAKAIHQQLTERSIYTNFAQMIGTPLYMSPEQAEMSAVDIDTRSDIYSLGVLLYELLTGSTPFERKRFATAAYDEIRRVIREEEPQRPSQRISTCDTLPSLAASRKTEPTKLSRILRGDLDWITMKALEKDRTRRYETANGLAMDVQRYLANEPVLASPPNPAYQFRKFLRRNKGPVIAAAMVLASLVLGIVGTSIGLVRADQRRVEAERARDAETTAKKEAEGEKKKAELARDAEAEAKRTAEAEKRKAEGEKRNAEAERKKAEAAEEQTREEFRASTDDAIEQLIGSKPELGPQEKTYLEKTLKRWQAFASRLGDDERTQANRAEGHFRVGLLWQRLGRHYEARSEYGTACRLQETLVQRYPDAPQHQRDLAATHHNQALLLKDLGEREAAQREYNFARDMFKKLSVQYPEVLIHQRDLALTHDNLGEVLADLGDREAARKEFETARNLRKNLTERNPTDPEYKVGLASSHCNLGELLADLGEREAARKEYETARDMQKNLTERYAVPRYQQDLAGTHHSLGTLLADLGEREAARREYETARDMHKKLMNQYPAVPKYQQGLAANHNGLGLLKARLGEREAARADYLTARDLYKKLAERYPTVLLFQQDMANIHNNLGMLLTDLGEREEARKEYETGRNLRKMLADKHPAVPVYQIDLGGSYCNLGNLEKDADKPVESLVWYDQAIATLEPVHRTDPRHVQARQYLYRSYRGRAESRNMVKKHAEAVKDWDRVIELTPPAEQAQYRSDRALSKFQAGLFAEAVAEVAELTQSSNWSDGHWYDFACVYAGSSGKIPGKKTEYSDRAMDLLRRAAKEGWKDVEHMKKDADLDSLRDRDDFKKLMAELERK